jgi:hypothetical protein
MLRKWTEFVIGIILIISPWVFGFSDISVAKWCNVLLGLLLALIAAWEVFGHSAFALAMLPEAPGPEPKKKRESKK